MSLQWLVLLTFAAFLQLAITATIDPPDVDDIPTIDNNAAYIDCSYYYRLTNAYSGPSLALAVNRSSGNYAVKMVPISNNKGQFWHCIHLGNNVYNLRTRSLKNQYSLDIVKDGTKIKPHMEKTDDVSGQRWHLTRLYDGTFKLSNDFTGNGKLLDVYSDSGLAQMSNATINYSGQHWTFHNIEKVL